MHSKVIKVFGRFIMPTYKDLILVWDVDCTRLYETISKLPFWIVHLLATARDCNVPCVHLIWIMRVQTMYAFEIVSPEQ